MAFARSPVAGGESARAESDNLGAQRALVTTHFPGLANRETPYYLQIRKRRRKKNKYGSAR